MEKILRYLWSGRRRFFVSFNRPRTSLEILRSIRASFKYCFYHTHHLLFPAWDWEVFFIRAIIVVVFLYMRSCCCLVKPWLPQCQRKYDSLLNFHKGYIIYSMTTVYYYFLKRRNYRGFLKIPVFRWNRRLSI